MLATIAASLIAAVGTGVVAYFTRKMFREIRDDQARLTWLNDRRYVNDVHCVSCGGYATALHDVEGLPVCKDRDLCRATMIAQNQIEGRK
jgi:hypothetical protein